MLMRHMTPNRVLKNSGLPKALANLFDRAAEQGATACVSKIDLNQFRIVPCKYNLPDLRSLTQV